MMSSSLLLRRLNPHRSLHLSSSIRSKQTKTEANKTVTSQVVEQEKSELPASPRISDIKPFQSGSLYAEGQQDLIDDRVVRISRPSKNVMQSGTSYMNCWKIEFTSQARWENWLMGWTSTADPLSNLTMTFPTREAAVAFCDSQNLQWFLEEQPERKMRRKSYADNFSWNKRTRTGNK